MSLVADYSSTSNDDTSSDEEIFSKKQISSEASKPTKLPSANAILSSSKPGEVFNNPYKEAENAKIAMLEKHVKMVDTEEHLKEKNGKKICWNYRKGRCRFGSNCTFAHDSDLQNNPTVDSGKDYPGSGHQKDIPVTATISKPQHGLQIAGKAMPSGTQQPICGTSSPESKTLNKKRNRPGLGDSIVPSKKVMKNYENLHKIKFH